jgi:hypothetical protein
MHINDVDLGPTGIVSVALSWQRLPRLIRDALIFAGRTADAATVNERIGDVANAVRSCHLKIAPLDPNLAGPGIAEGGIEDEFGERVRNGFHRPIAPIGGEVTQILEDKIDRCPVELLGDIIR